MNKNVESGRAIASRNMTFVDRSRSIKASAGFSGAPERRIDAIVWYHAESIVGKRSPLIVYCHGTAGHPDNATYLVEELVRGGAIVVAPNFPLTSTTAFTQVAVPDISDTGEQLLDVSFVIDSMLADPLLGPAIDDSRIASAGHSLGAITCWFLSFNAKSHDPRIRATVMLGAGDPRVSAQAADLGLENAEAAQTGIPALLISAEKDLFTRMMGPHGTAFARLSEPKFEVMIAGGVHLWFNDNGVWPEDHKNPDSMFFEEHSPGFVVPGSEERVPLIGPSRQRAITVAATQAFFDLYLNRDEKARDRFYDLTTSFPEITMTSSE